MATYVYDRETGRMVHRQTREPMVSGPWKPSAPVVRGDIEGYQSPIDGSWVDGNRARRYDMEKNNCVDGNDFIPAGGRKLKNKRFVDKFGLHEISER